MKNGNSSFVEIPSHLACPKFQTGCSEVWIGNWTILGLKYCRIKPTGRLKAPVNILEVRFRELVFLQPSYMLLVQ